jgi:hypothetical protein
MSLSAIGINVVNILKKFQILGWCMEIKPSVWSLSVGSSLGCPPEHILDALVFANQYHPIMQMGYYVVVRISGRL